MVMFRGREGRPGDRSRVLVIVQNLHVPFDRRVWLECLTLVAGGYDVTVICPRGKDSLPYQVIDRVAIHTYRPYAPGGSAAGFVLEYVYSLLATTWLAFKARRRGHFDVVQACNPPDIFWILARVLRMLDGSRFVFDHHDLCPELYESRFKTSATLAHRGLLFLERATFHTADRVTSTNESYARIARLRGGKAPEAVTIVRTGPDPDKLKPGPVDPGQRRGRTYLAAYIGVMGPQDGVDVIVRAADVVVHELHRDDIAFTIMGAGDCYNDLIALRDRLGLQGIVEFTGRVPDETVSAVLSTADVGLCPDPRNPLNDVSTMNKTMEYMAFELPVLSFDLVETRVSAQDAAHYVETDDVAAFARGIVELIDEPEERARMGRRGRERVVSELAWGHQQAGYLAVFDDLTGVTRRDADLADAGLDVAVTEG